MASKQTNFIPSQCWFQSPRSNSSGKLLPDSNFNVCVSYFCNLIYLIRKQAVKFYGSFLPNLRSELFVCITVRVIYARSENFWKGFCSSSRPHRRAQISLYKLSSSVTSATHAVALAQTKLLTSRTIDKVLLPKEVPELLRKTSYNQSCMNHLIASKDSDSYFRVEFLGNLWITQSWVKYSINHLNCQINTTY